MKKLIYSIFIMMLFFANEIHSSDSKKSSSNTPSFMFRFANVLRGVSPFISQYINLDYPFIDLIVPFIGYYNAIGWIEKNIINKAKYRRPRHINNYISSWRWKQLAFTVALMFIRPELNVINSLNLLTSTADPKYQLRNSQEQFESATEKYKDYDLGSKEMVDGGFKGLIGLK